MPRLIVNADDFGLTSGVNRAIAELHHQGVLTSATLMANAPATQEAVDIALATPSLGVGCHVVLVDGEPLLSAADDIPNISQAVRQRFEPTLGRLLSAIYRQGSPRKVASQMEAEARAQIQSLQARGIALTHVDCHKHTHMFPRILRPVLRAARSCGITRVRNPFEPAWSSGSTPGASFVRRAEVALLRRLAGTFHRIVAEEGFTTTAGSLGVLATGTLDAATIRSILRSIPTQCQQDTFELVTHPGYNDEALAAAHTRLLASRETERSALAVLRETSWALVHFGQLSVPET